MVESQDADVVTESGEAVSQRFLLQLADLRKQFPDQHLGVSWRWVLGVKQDSNDLVLELLALPCSAAAIAANPVLANDTTSGVKLLTWDLAYNKFRSSRAAGPIPVLFSTAPARTKALLKSSPKQAFDWLQQLVGKLLRREELTL